MHQVARVKAKTSIWLLALLLVVASACTAAPNRIIRDGATSVSTSAEVNRTLVVAMRVEPNSLVASMLNPEHVGIAPGAPWQIFHAGLMQLDENSKAQLQLAETSPRLNTETWKVFPDGRMQTTWRLRPNLTWHDGTPLTADDFVLAVRYAKATRADRLPEVEEISAPDSRTIVVQYKAPFPDAGEVTWQPVPRHIVGPALEQMEAREVFETLPYWTTEFVGVGPYALERWEPGAFIAGVAFPGYVKGKPRIGRIQLVWIADANTAVANLLAGTVHLASDFGLTFEQVPVLKREWGAGRESGTVLLGTASTVYVQLQFRPEYVKPPDLLDLRMRQALAQSIDKQAIVDAVLDGEPGIAETLVAKQEDYYPELDQALRKYPLDPSRTEQQLTDMGYRKDGEGFYGRGANRLSIGLTPLGEYQREALILADGWKRSGIEVPIQTLSAAERRDQKIASIFPALIITQQSVGPYPFWAFTSSTLASETTRWAGRNKGGYFDPEIDRLADVFNSSLDRADRNRAVIKGLKLLSEQAAYFPLYYGYQVVGHTGLLAGPRAGRKDEAMWNVEQWSWR
jgi:peptide/nickel transport system substrate-binding protein